VIPKIKFGDLYKQLDEFVEDLESLDEDELVRIGIGSDGPASEYALVWEWGNVRQTKQGPKTVRGTNPDGSEVWLTIQAPFGYIRVNTPKYWQIVYLDMEKINFAKSGKEIDRQIRMASERITEGILAILRETVPVDDGQLRDSLRVFTEIEMAE